MQCNWKIKELSFLLDFALITHLLGMGMSDLAVESFFLFLYVFPVLTGNFSNIFLFNFFLASSLIWLCFSFFWGQNCEYQNFINFNLKVYYSKKIRWFFSLIIRIRIYLRFQIRGRSMFQCIFIIRFHQILVCVPVSLILANKINVIINNKLSRIEKYERKKECF